MPLPVFKISGDIYHVGLEVGKKFKIQMEEFYENYEPLHKTFIPFYNTSKGLELYNKLLNHSTKYFSDYVDEIKGYSKGSGLPFNYFFLTLIRVEIVTVLFNDIQMHNECSDVFINNQKLKLIGHNEDMSAAIKGRGYILDCEIIKDNKTIEKFVAYSYPGHLPGNCMGYNCLNINPIIITMDGLSTIFAKFDNSTPRGILCRAVIGKGNKFSTILDILTDKGHGSTVGFSVNIAKVCPKIQMYNVEVSPSKSQDLHESSLNIIKISIAKEYYFHFNKYEHTPDAQEIPSHIISSQHRQATAKNYVAEHGMETKQDVLNVLGDASDKEHPIYREGFESDTLATGIFNLETRTWELYEDNPKFHPSLFTLNF